MPSLKLFWPIFLPVGSPIRLSMDSCGGGFRWRFPGASTGPRSARTVAAFPVSARSIRVLLRVAMMTLPLRTVPSGHHSEERGQGSLIIPCDGNKKRGRAEGNDAVIQGCVMRIGLSLVLTMALGASLLGDRAR